MKKLYSLLIVLLTSVTSFAQVPQSFNYQAMLRDLTEDPLDYQSIAVQISLIQAEPSGTPVYVERFATQTDAFGLLNLMIGTGDVQSGVIEDINWSAGPYFIKVEVDKDGGTSFVEFGTSQLLSVPYAIYSNTAENIIEEQTLADVILKGNSANGQIKDLDNPAEDQDAATKAYVDELILSTMNTFARSNEYFTSTTTGTIKDIDGRIYSTIRIGDQWWMAENLATTKLNDGQPIPKVTDNADWYNLTSLGYCWYNNDSLTFAADYGALYNWYSVETGKLCPAGWHVPFDGEWTELTDYLGWNAGSMMKETGTIHWIAPNDDATNESGFTALPGGTRNHLGGGLFGLLGEIGFWWTSTQYDINSPWYRDIRYYGGIYSFHNLQKTYGCSIRCIRD